MSAFLGIHIHKADIADPQPQTHKSFNKMFEEQNALSKAKDLVTSVRELADCHPQPGMHDAWISNPPQSSENLALLVVKNRSIER